jgi:hypothetical protein
MGVDEMSKEKALFIFLNSFGVPAYPSTSVPDEVAFPYLTYTVQDGGFDTVTAMVLQLWYKTDSEAVPNAKVREIKEKISEGGTFIFYDGGSAWLTYGSPFCINSAWEGDSTVKLRQININVNHL